MDILFSAALQEVAVEGPEGCTLPKLRALLQTSGNGTGINMAGQSQQLLWQKLIEIPGMVVLLSNSQRVPASDPRVQAVHEAEKLRVRLVAPDTLRDGSLGLYDLKVCDARLSKEQRDILERIAKSRNEGITQNQLAKEFKVAGNRIFYLVRMLEARGLVVRQTTLVRTSNGNSENSKQAPIVNTNLLHLTRYAKDLTLSSHQRFEILNTTKENALDAPNSAVDDVVGEEMGKPRKGKEYVIKDDYPAMQAICQRLEETEGKVLVVSDLKSSLGYRLAAGHRAWRRLVKRLEDAGVVEVFSAQVERKVQTCIRLLKSFDMKALSSTNEEIENEHSLNCLKHEKVTEMVMELPIDQQIYDLVSQSGSDGVQMMEVFNRLGLQNKRNYSRVTTMLGRQCLVSEAENHKRSTLYRLKTAENASGSTQKSAIVLAEDHQFAPPAETASPLTSDLIKDPKSVSVSVEFPFEVVPKVIKETAHGTSQSGSKSMRKEKNLESVQDEIGLGNCDQSETDKGGQVLFLTGSNVAGPSHDLGSGSHGLQVDCVVPPNLSPSPVSTTRTGQHFSGSSGSTTTTRAQREQRILEKLQAEKFVLRVELHKWLEGVENRKDTVMDRKTLSRILQAFQREGLCKCVLLSMPGLTNCGRQRNTEVVLLPSIDVDPELLSKVHDRVRKFDMESRGHGISRVRRKDDVPVLTGVKRMQKPVHAKQTTSKFEAPNDGGWSMQANGFIPAKMVRVSMLHYFLWGYVNSLPDSQMRVLDGSESSGEMVGSCRIFGLANAVQTMPLELFLQIIGSTYRLEHTKEWCKQGLRLCDLPKEDVKIILDSNATGRLSWLVDVLRRLKLVRLVMGCGPGAQDTEDLGKFSLSAILTYAMEREPYIEEPAPNPLPSFSLDTYDLSPRARHEFNIVNRDGLDAYWQTLEYFYSGAQTAIARLAFPGSNVPELFGLRSWTSLRIMSVDQRSELLKRVGAGGMETRKSAQECVKIAKELNLSLEQVLRVSYEKNRVFRLQTLQRTGQTSRKRTVASDDLAEPSHVKAYKKQRRLQLDDVLALESVTEEKRDKSHTGVEEGGQADHDVEDDDDEEENEGSNQQPMNDFSFVANLKPSRLRSRRFLWSEKLDRLLITAYARQRAMLGVMYPRVDWSTMENLPATAVACRRRMAQLRQDLGVRKAVMSLCSLVAARYLRRCELQTTKSLDAGGKPSCISPPAGSVSDSGLATADSHHSLTESRKESKIEDMCGNVPSGLDRHDTGTDDGDWADMSEPFLAAALDEVIRCKNVAKSTVSKRGNSGVMKTTKTSRRTPISASSCDGDPVVVEDLRSGYPAIPSSFSSNLSRSLQAVAAARAASLMTYPQMYSTTDSGTSFNVTATKDSTTSDEEMNPHGSGLIPARLLTAAGPTRRVRKQVPNILRKSLAVHEMTSEQLVRNSVGISNAVELVKLVLLNSIEETELSGPLVDAVQRLKEAEVFTAVKFLREQGLLVAAQVGHTFVLSPKFFHDCSASRFPVGTGDEWLSSQKWLYVHMEEIDKGWVPLPPQQQSGQLSHLLALVSTEEFCLNPSLPSNDIGEVEEKGKRKAAAQRIGEDFRNVKSRTESPYSTNWVCERRERGFPGIEVSLTRSGRSVAAILDTYVSGSERACMSFSTNTLMSTDKGFNGDSIQKQTPTLDRTMIDPVNATTVEDAGIPALSSYGKHSVSKISVADESIPALSEGILGVACTATCGASTRSNLDDCLTYWHSKSLKSGVDENKPPTHLSSEVLKEAYHAVEQAGEEGLTFEALAKVLKTSGLIGEKDLVKLEDSVQTMESFDLVKKVKAFDHVRIIEFTRSVRFHLNILPEGHKESQRSYSSPLCTSDANERSQKTQVVKKSRRFKGAGGDHGKISRVDQPLSATAAASTTAGSDEHRVIPLRREGDVNSLNEQVPIVPWLNRYGKIHVSMMRGLTRRVMGIVTLHPGIPEDMLIEQLNVLNPESARELLHSLELDGHLVVRFVEQPKSVGPRLLKTGLPRKKLSSQSSLMKHFFVTPLSGGLL